MKCFSLLFLLSSLAFGEVFSVRPIDQSKISTGDVLSVEITAESGAQDVPQFVGERIGGIFYVLEQKNNELKVIVANPQSVKDVREKPQDKFRLIGFDYEFKKSNPMQEFLIEDKEYNLTNSKSFLSLFLIVVVGSLYFLFFFYRKRQNAKKLKELERAKALDLVEKFKRASNREELEELFSFKDSVRSYLEFKEKDYLAFIEKLNSHQYKKDWSQEDLEEIKEALAKLNKSLSVKSGI